MHTLPSYETKTKKDIEKKSFCFAFCQNQGGHVPPRPPVSVGPEVALESNKSSSVSCHGTHARFRGLILKDQPPLVGVFLSFSITLLL